LMLIAIGVFVMSDYFTLWPHRQPQSQLNQHP
jgi:hypothetical protein